MRRGRTAADGRGVHDVVVVQRREVRQLDDDRGVAHLRPRRVAEVAGEQREHRPHPLATGLHEVPAGVVGQPVALVHRRGELLLHRREAVPDRGVERVVADPQIQGGRHGCRGGACVGHRAHGRKIDDEAARSSAHDGMTPRTTVASAPIPTATTVRTPGVATIVPSPEGSLKYMSTITRT